MVPIKRHISIFGRPATHILTARWPGGNAVGGVGGGGAGTMQVPCEPESFCSRDFSRCSRPPQAERLVAAVKTDGGVCIGDRADLRGGACPPIFRRCVFRSALLRQVLQARRPRPSLRDVRLDPLGCRRSSANVTASARSETHPTVEDLVSKRRRYRVPSLGSRAAS